MRTVSSDASRTIVMLMRVSPAHRDALAHRCEAETSDGDRVAQGGHLRKQKYTPLVGSRRARTRRFAEHDDCANDRTRGGGVLHDARQGRRRLSVGERAARENDEEGEQETAYCPHVGLGKEANHASGLASPP